MKIKTAELEGTTLDWAVAQCEGEETHMHHGKLNTRWSNPSYSPTTDWSQGGPIIDRERFNFLDQGECIAAYKSNGSRVNQRWSGKTHLIAAMRCYVASKLGDELEVPDEVA